MRLALCTWLCASNSTLVTPCWCLCASISMLVTLCKYLRAGNSARVSPCWYLHAGDSAQATLRKLTKSCASYSAQATLRKLTKSSARKSPSPCFREKTDLQLSFSRKGGVQFVGEFDLEPHHSKAHRPTRSSKGRSHCDLLAKLGRAQPQVGQSLKPLMPVFVGFVSKLTPEEDLSLDSFLPKQTHVCSPFASPAKRWSSNLLIPRTMQRTTKASAGPLLPSKYPAF